MKDKQVVMKVIKNERTTSWEGVVLVLSSSREEQEEQLVSY